MEPLTIPAQVFAAGRRFAGRVAIRGEDGSEIGYAEIEPRAMAAAAAFVAAGVMPGDRVAIWAPNSPEWIIAALGLQSAGGVLVPIDDDTLYADLFAAWRLPVVLVARTTLGTINHSLLSLEALRERSVDIAGVIFSGEENAASEAAMAR